MFLTRRRYYYTLNAIRTGWNGSKTKIYWVNNISWIIGDVLWSHWLESGHMMGWANQAIRFGSMVKGYELRSNVAQMNQSETVCSHNQDRPTWTERHTCLLPSRLTAMVTPCIPPVVSSGINGELGLGLCATIGDRRCVVTRLWGRSRREAIDKPGCRHLENRTRLPMKTTDSAHLQWTTRRNRLQQSGASRRWPTPTVDAIPASLLVPAALQIFGHARRRIPPRFGQIDLLRTTHHC
jgi:hypothetical protein